MAAISGQQQRIGRRPGFGPAHRVARSLEGVRLHSLAIEQGPPLLFALTAWNALLLNMESPLLSNGLLCVTQSSSWVAVQVMWEAALQIVAQDAAEAASVQEAATLALAAMAANGLAPPSMSASHVFSQPGLIGMKPATLGLLCATFAHGNSTRQ